MPSSSSCTTGISAAARMVGCSSGLSHSHAGVAVLRLSLSPSSTVVATTSGIASEALSSSTSLRCNASFDAPSEVAAGRGFTGTRAAALVGLSAAAIRRAAAASASAQHEHCTMRGARLFCNSERPSAARALCGRVGRVPPGCAPPAWRAEPLGRYSNRSWPLRESSSCCGVASLSLKR